MKTLLFFESAAQFIPQITAWHLADLGECLGKQKLYERQSPQKLKALKEHAIIESAVSSNRIEGVTIDPSRIKEVVLGRAHLRDRDEEEVRGYRNALELIHTQSRFLKVSEETICELHRLTRAGIGDAGKYKSRDSATVSPRGSKTEMVHHVIHAIGSDFTVADIEKKCPAVSRDMIRTVLKNMQKSGEVECVGCGAWSGCIMEEKG